MALPVQQDKMIFVYRDIIWILEGKNRFPEQFSIFCVIQVMDAIPSLIIHVNCSLTQETHSIP